MAPRSAVLLEPKQSNQIERFAEDFNHLYLENAFLKAELCEAEYAMDSLVLNLESTAVLITDKAGTIRQANSPACALLGACTEARLTGSRLQEWLSSDTWEFLYSLIDQATTGKVGTILKRERLFQTTDDRARHFQVSLILLREHEDQNELCWLLEEQWPQAADEKPESVSPAHNSSLGMLVTDQNDVIEWVNQGFTDITGWEKREVIGKRPGMLKSGKQDASFYKGMRHQLAADGFWSGRLWNRRRDGTPVLVHLSISAVQDNDGRVQRYIAYYALPAENDNSLSANFDDLTGLASRKLFLGRIQKAIEGLAPEAGLLACFFIDFDRFKSINDSLGHAAGDDFLKEASRRLIGAVRGSDTVARLGGDEFAVLVANLAQERDAEVIASKILGALAPAAQLAGGEIGMSASIGISLFPRDGSTPEELISHADMAMYQAKARGNHFCLYSKELGDHARSHRAIEAGLRKAIAQNELRLLYQPIVAPNGDIEAVEALMRWRSPELGDIPPDRFIAVAEDLGLIHGIGAWALETACRQQVAWRNVFPHAPRMAVNASAKQIVHPDFFAMVACIVEATGIRPQDLEIEVTEGPLMERLGHAIDNMGRLHACGIGLAIDDFGTGHSSLNRLRALPVKTLKIDRSFVKDLHDDADAHAIVAAILSLAESLDMNTIAEGVETEAHREVLAAKRCSLMQGYLFARPSPPEDIERMLAKLPSKTA